MSSYRIARGSLKTPLANHDNPLQSKFLRQGDLLPEGMYSEADIASYLESGRIEEVDASARNVAEQAEVIRARGLWTVNPSILEGKSLEDLRILINEIDPNVDASTVETEEVAIQFLTQNWQPALAQTVPAASDRSRPEAMATVLEQKGGRPAVQTGTVAPSALDAARAKAQAPSSDD